MFPRHLTSLSRRLLSALLYCFPVKIGVPFVISACSVGPDYHTPEMSLPDGWQQALHQPVLSSDKQLGAYWQALGDQQLTRFVELALAQNLSLQQAALRVEQARALYRVQRGSFFPDIDLTADLRKRRRSEAVASAITDPNNDLLSLGGVLDWEIDLLGRVRRLTEAADARVESQAEAYYGTRVSILAELVATYVRLRTRESEIDLTLKNISSQAESLKLTSERYQAGVAPELDFRQAESNLAETEAALPALRIARARELHRLAVLLGIFPDQLAADLESAEQLPDLPEFPKDNLPLQILRQRPDLRQAERALAAEHALIGAREAELYPVISMPGVISFEALNNLEHAFERGSLAYSIGPAVRWNFLDMSRTRGNIAAQQLRMQEAESAYREQVLNAVQQVEDAIVALEQQKLRRLSLEKSVTASLRARELVKSGYLAGLTDFQNVLDSERRLFAQELSLAESRGAALEAYVALFRALGGGLGSSVES